MMLAANSKRAPGSRVCADFGPCLPRPAVALPVPSCARIGSTPQPASGLPGASIPAAGSSLPPAAVGKGRALGDAAKTVTSEYFHGGVKISVTMSKPPPNSSYCQPPAHWGPPLITSSFSHCPLRSQVAFFHQARLIAQPEKG